MTRRTVADWLQLPVAERQELARESLVSAKESTDALNTYISVVDEKDLDLASDGELASVPYAVKDNIDVQGLPTTGGTPSLVGSYPTIDNSLVRALRGAGAAAIGKVNMHELAFGLTSNNGHFGPARNPVDPERVSGGSSGGSAATVAYGTVPFALGTDTGASVTVPSSYCGVVGYRPTTGRYPGDGLIHLTWTRDAIGLHANTVADIQLIDRVITRVPAVPETPAPNTLRIGVPESYYADIDPAVEATTQHVLDALRAAGVELVTVEVPRAMELGAAGFSMVFYETPIGFRNYVGQLSGKYRELTVEDIVNQLASPDVKDLLDMLIDKPVSAEAYLEAADQRNLLRRFYQQTFADSGIDALLFPTAPNLPPPVGDDAHIELNGSVRDMFPTATRNVAPGGLAGAPQLNIPTTRGAGELPVGMTLEGGIGTDSKLLSVGAAVADLI